MMPSTILAPAKINLYLGVEPQGGVESHGMSRCSAFHTVTTIMAPVSLYDELSFVPASQWSLQCKGETPCSQEDNLVFRAAKMFDEVFSVSQCFAITLTKNIPAQAGLGGGSSDAAACLRWLCNYYSVSLQDKRVIDIARSLGADVPFFLYNSWALMTGRGDILAQQFVGMSIFVVLAKSRQTSVSTAAAYKAFDENPVVPVSPQPLITILESLATQGTSSRQSKSLQQATSLQQAKILVPHLYNNLQSAVFSESRAVRQTYDWLLSQSESLAVLLCGSGAASMALCQNEQEAKTLTARATQAGLWATSAQTLLHKNKLISTEFFNLQGV